MKRFLIIFLCLLMASCQKELPARLEIVQPSLSAESDAGGVTVDIISTRAWTVQTDVPWCKVLPNTGNGGTDAATPLYVVCEANTLHEARNCTITISSGSLTRTVTLTQNHRQGVLVPVARYDIGPEATTFEVQLWKTTAYTAEVDAACKDWLQIIQTRSMSEGALVVQVSENLSIPREGTICLRGGDREEIITIRQNCGFVKFEDPVFEKICVQSFDRDHDGKVSASEALQAEVLVVMDKVTSLKGLEFFTKLRHLVCYACGLDLDIRPFADLEILEVHNAERLVVRGNSKLLYLYAYEIGSVLDISDCPALELFRIWGLDAPQFSIRSCPALATMELSVIQGLETLVIKNLPSLERCTLSGSNILGATLFDDLPRLEVLDCQYNIFGGELQFSACPALNRFWCTDSNLERLDLSSVPSLEWFGCSNNPLKELDLSGSVNLKSLQLDRTALETFDFSGTPSLETLECFDSPVKALDFTGMRHLSSVFVWNCELTSLVVKDNPELWWVECPNNKIEYLEIQDCEKLSTLRFNNNLVQTLVGWTHLGAMTELYCDNNQLTTLDVSGMPDLRNLFCTYNQLSSLDLRSNYNLSQVSTYYNPGLKDIYLRPGQEIYFLGYDETVTTLHYEE